MTTKYPKLLLVIGNKQFDFGDEIVIEEELKSTFMKVSFNLPFFETSNFSTKQIKRYDVAQIYFNFFTNAFDRQNANIDSMIKIFDGYVHNIPVSESKGTGIKYNSVTLRSAIALMYERSATIAFYTGNLNFILDQAIQQTNFTQYVNQVLVDPNIGSNLIFKIENSTFFGEVLDGIKQKYAVQIFQTGNKDLYFQFPSSFNGEDVTTFPYDMKVNCFNMNYGDLTQKIDTVIVVGLNCLGIAFDPIAYQLKNGVSPDELSGTVVPDKNLLNPRLIYRRDVFDEETAQRIARETLLELAQNYTISFDGEFFPEQRVGQRFVIQNSQVLDESQKWIIKRRTITYQKSGAIKCNITGYANSIGDFPTDIALDSSGIFDVDILSLQNREVNSTTLH